MPSTHDFERRLNQAASFLSQLFHHCHGVFALRKVLRRLAATAVATDARQHDRTDCSLQNKLRGGERIIEPGAVFQFLFVGPFFIHDELRGAAAFRAHDVHFEGDPGSASDGERGVAFRFLHADSIDLQRS